jgi:hypothetical protein
MSEQDVREDVPPAPGDETSPMGDTPEAEQQWEENEPSPHQGEAGQQESGA